jgi:hypothetical protein
MALLTLGAAAAGFCLFAPRHHIDREHFALIQEGMTEAQVESIVGAPAGNYDGFVEASQFWHVEILWEGKDTCHKVWASRHGSIRIYFAFPAAPRNQTKNNSEVATCHFYASEPRNWFATAMNWWRPRDGNE